MDFTPITKGITFSCDVTYYNENYECIGETNSSGEIIIEFISPEDMKALKFEFLKTGVNCSYKDTEYKSQKIKNAVT